MSTEYHIRETIIYGLRAGRIAKAIFDFNSIPLQTAFNKVYDATSAQENYEIHKDCSSPDIVHRIKVMINEDPRKLMRCIAKEIVRCNYTQNRSRKYQTMCY